MLQPYRDSVRFEMAFATEFCISRCTRTCCGCPAQLAPGDVALRQRHFQYHDPRARQAESGATGGRAEPTVPGVSEGDYGMTKMASKNAHKKKKDPKFLDAKNRRKQHQQG